MKQYCSVWHAPMAFWGGNKTGPNRISLTAPTQSSAVGMLRRVLGHRGVHWDVHEVRILQFSGRLPVTTKELTHYPRNKVIEEDTNRTTRTWVYLANVVISMLSSMHSDDPAKYESMFERRMNQGQVFDLIPTMGPKQCMVSDFRLAEPNEDLSPLPLYEDLGLQPYGQDFDDPKAPWYYAPMSIEGGVVRYPSWEEVRALGLRRTLGDAP